MKCVPLLYICEATKAKEASKRLEAKNRADKVRAERVETLARALAKAHYEALREPEVETEVEFYWSDWSEDAEALLDSIMRRRPHYE